MELLAKLSKICKKCWKIGFNDLNQKRTKESLAVLEGAREKLRNVKKTFSKNCVLPGIVANLQYRQLKIH